MAKRAERRKAPAIAKRHNSRRLSHQSSVNVSMPTIERSLASLCAAWCGESLVSFIRKATTARCVAIAKGFMEATNHERRLPVARTQDDEARADAMVSSILSDAPSSTRIISLANELSSLLSADDDVVS